MNENQPVDAADLIFDCEEPGFELAAFLGYRDCQSFFKSAVNRAQSVCPCNWKCDGRL